METNKNEIHSSTRVPPLPNLLKHFIPQHWKSCRKRRYWWCQNLLRFVQTMCLSKHVREGCSMRLDNHEKTRRSRKDHKFKLNFKIVHLKFTSNIFC